MEQTILFVNDTVAPQSVEGHRLRPFSLFNSATHARRPITMVASVGVNNELGRDGNLCWHIREDLKHFKETTMGGAVIMGRKTWESLPRRPLPGRTNIVISRNPSLECPGALKAASLEDALIAAEDNRIFIIGGASVYKEAMPLANVLELTRILAEDPGADTFFPDIDPKEWALEKESELMTSAEGINFIYQTYVRKA